MQVNTQIAISYPDIALVCNPFSQPPYYEYQPQNCAANTIRIGDIPKVNTLRRTALLLLFTFKQHRAKCRFCLPLTINIVFVRYAKLR